MAWPNLTEAQIRQYAADETFQRGREYYQQGAVLTLVRRGTTLQAEVEGSMARPYQVRCTFDPPGQITATCTCPYEWGGWCKHIVAALLACIKAPETIEERPTLESTLEKLKREDLLAILLKLSSDHEIAERIERQATLLQTTVSSTPSPGKTGASPRRTPPDVKAIRRQVRSAIHSTDGMRASEAYWQVGGVVNEVRQTLEKAWDFIKADDGNNALLLLEAITDEYQDAWETLDDSDGEVGDFYYNDLGPAWTEAILTADLDPEERELWADKLEEWQRDASDYGIDDAFDDAISAAQEGWDSPLLQRILAGKPVEMDEDELDISDEEAYLISEVTPARLRILERRGRYEEYLRLAKAEGETESYITMLTRLGRAQEAIQHSRAHMHTTQEAFALAKALTEQGQLEDALQMAEHGLTLEGPKVPLATWLRETAAGLGQTSRALDAALVVMREEISLTAYLRVQDLAGERWEELRSGILEQVRRVRSFYPRGQVEIFLHEGLLDDAIATLKESAPDVLVEQVADAAITARPEWVIQVCRKRAEAIMDAGKASHYDTAVGWLRKVRAAYLAANRAAEWNTYQEELLDLHRKKYKLVPMIKALSSGKL
jgi:uncharacterized Zn finger protein